MLKSIQQFSRSIFKFLILLVFPEKRKRQEKINQFRNSLVNLKKELENTEEPNENIDNNLYVWDLEIGYDLILLVEGNAPLLIKIKKLRSHMRKDLGFIVPGVYIKDNLAFRPCEFAIIIREKIILRKLLILDDLGNDKNRKISPDDIIIYNLYQTILAHRSELTVA